MVQSFSKKIYKISFTLTSINNPFNSLCYTNILVGINSKKKKKPSLLTDQAKNLKKSQKKCQILVCYQAQFWVLNYL